MMRWSVPTSRDVLVFFCYRLGLFLSDQTACLPASPLMRGHLQCFASPECHNVSDWKSVLKIYSTCTVCNCIEVEKYQIDPVYRVFIKPLHQVKLFFVSPPSSLVWWWSRFPPCQKLEKLPWSHPLYPRPWTPFWIIITHGPWFTNTDIINVTISLFLHFSLCLLFANTLFIQIREGVNKKNTFLVVFFY